MKIIFIYSVQEIQSSKTPISTWHDIAFGISYISSFLKEHGHQTNLLVLGSDRWKKNIKLIESCVEKFDPDIFCYTSTFSQYSFIKRIAEFTKNKWPGKFRLIGGVHPSLNPDEVIGGPFNALCIGEGEYSTLELCNQLEEGKIPCGIKNLWIKLDDKLIEKNPPRDFIQDIDKFPIPDREMWRRWIRETDNHEIAILLGRGCPYNCTYCSNHALRKIAYGRYTRTRSADNILKELLHVHAHFKDASKRIYFEIETIAAKKDWAINLCEKIQEFNKITDNHWSYGCNFRVSKNSIDERLFTAFQKANFYKINIGLESGSERVRREVLKRNYSNQDFLDAALMARKYGLKVYIFNMIGIPGETLDDHLETVALNRRFQPDWHYTGIFFPYPGTDLYDVCIKNGLIKKSIDNTMERKKAVLDLPGFSKADIENAYAWFNYRIYKGHRSFLLLLFRAVRIKIMSNAVASYIYYRVVRLPILSSIRKSMPFFRGEA